MKNLTMIVVAMAIIFFAGLGVASADESSWGIPKPGLAVKTGGGGYYSVPCGCMDRGVWDTEVSLRLHFGWRAAVESGIHQGAMLLGGRFPTDAWSMGGRLSLLSEQGRWWEGISLRSGYRFWRAMGMRSGGTHGMYGALSWAVEVFPHLYVETDALAVRNFRAMQHWELGGRLGLSTRF